MALRDFFISLSENQMLSSAAQQYGLKLWAQNVIAGTTISEVIESIKELNTQGISCTIDHLGDFVADEAEATTAKEIYSDEWNGYKRGDCVHVMSVTKSVMALLVGIAIDQGLIGSVDDKVLSYFPDYTIKRGEKTIQEVTIRHLMTMKAPYKCKGDPWTKVCTSENWTTASLDFLGGRKGLTDEFNYQTVCLHILSGILYRVTKMRTVDYANQFLFEPIGIKERTNFYAKSAHTKERFFITRPIKWG